MHQGECDHIVFSCIIGAVFDEGDSMEMLSNLKVRSFDRAVPTLTICALLVGRAGLAITSAFVGAALAKIGLGEGLLQSWVSRFSAQRPTRLPPRPRLFGLSFWPDTVGHTATPEVSSY